MQIQVQGKNCNVSFREVTDKTDDTRVVQCLIKEVETQKLLAQAVSVAKVKNKFYRIEEEKLALGKTLSKVLPTQKNNRREIWWTYLTSTVKRRRLAPALVKQLSDQEQAH